MSLPAATHIISCQFISVIFRSQKNLGLIGKISATLAESNLNIENMSNKSCGGNAYTLIEVTGDVADNSVGELSQIRGMRRVRLIPPS